MRNDNKKTPKIQVLIIDEDKNCFFADKNGLRSMGLIELFEQYFDVKLNEGEKGLLKKIHGLQRYIKKLENVPPHLLKTYVALHKARKASAEQLEEMTGIMRSMSSKYANELVNLGYARRKGKREERKVIFYAKD